LRNSLSVEYVSDDFGYSLLCSLLFIDRPVIMPFIFYVLNVKKLSYTVMCPN